MLLLRRVLWALLGCAIGCCWAFCRWRTSSSGVSSWKSPFRPLATADLRYIRYTHIRILMSNYIIIHIHILVSGGSRSFHLSESSEVLLCHHKTLACGSHVPSGGQPTLMSRLKRKTMESKVNCKSEAFVYAGEPLNAPEMDFADPSSLSTSPRSRIHLKRDLSGALQWFSYIGSDF